MRSKRLLQRVHQQRVAARLDGPQPQAHTGVGGVPDHRRDLQARKAERFNRTLADEFLYAKRFRSENERRIRLKRWIHNYNCHRHHTAVGGPPASRANNLTRTDS